MDAADDGDDAALTRALELSRATALQETVARQRSEQELINQILRASCSESDAHTKRCRELQEQEEEELQRALRASQAESIALEEETLEASRTGSTGISAGALVSDSSATQEHATPESLKALCADPHRPAIQKLTTPETLKALCAHPSPVGGTRCAFQAFPSGASTCSDGSSSNNGNAEDPPAACGFGLDRKTDRVTSNWQNEHSVTIRNESEIAIREGVAIDDLADQRSMMESPTASIITSAEFAAVSLTKPSGSAAAAAAVMKSCSVQASCPSASKPKKALPRPLVRVSSERGPELRKKRLLPRPLFKGPQPSGTPLRDGREISEGSSNIFPEASKGDSVPESLHPPSQNLDARPLIVRQPIVQPDMHEHVPGMHSMLSSQPSSGSKGPACLPRRRPSALQTDAWDRSRSPCRNAAPRDAFSSALPASRHESEKPTLRQVSVNNIHFTHDSIKPCFRDGRRLEDLISQLLSREVCPLQSDFLRLDVMNVDGKLFSENNRRLYCLKEYQKQASYDVQVSVLETRAVGRTLKFLRAYTTRCGGHNVMLRKRGLGLPQSDVIAWQRGHGSVCKRR